MGLSETQLSLTREDGQTVHILGWGVLLVRSGKSVGAMCSVEDVAGRRAVYIGSHWTTLGLAKVRVDSMRSRPGKVCLSFRAPPSVRILRGELVEGE